MAADDVEFTVTIRDGETVIEMVGDRDAAVVVRSASGERIYLPPEDFERPAGGGDSPYQSVDDEGAARRSDGETVRRSVGEGPPPTDDDSPYQSARVDSPYQSARVDSPYQSVGSTGGDDDSPYQSARARLPDHGLRPTADGFLIRHPEPVTDLRLLR
ncbi:MAG: hypothetical protein ABEJ28_09475 [Salinigranum sp.]